MTVEVAAFGIVKPLNYRTQDSPTELSMAPLAWPKNSAARKAGDAVESSSSSGRLVSSGALSSQTPARRRKYMVTPCRILPGWHLFGWGR